MAHKTDKGSGGHAPRPS